ncbi:MAG: hypothetical protein WAM88_07865, partial [Nitrososphaeraceae archaeon]
ALAYFLPTKWPHLAFIILERILSHTGDINTLKWTCRFLFLRPYYAFDHTGCSWKQLGRMEIE